MSLRGNQTQTTVLEVHLDLEVLLDQVDLQVLQVHLVLEDLQDLQVPCPHLRLLSAPLIM